MNYHLSTISTLYDEISFGSESRQTQSLRKSNFVLPLSEFHFVDLDKIRERKEQKMSDCEQNNDTTSSDCTFLSKPAVAETGGDGQSDKNRIKKYHDQQKLETTTPLHATVLVREQQGQWRIRKENNNLSPSSEDFPDPYPYDNDDDDDNLTSESEQEYKYRSSDDGELVLNPNGTIAAATRAKIADDDEQFRLLDSAPKENNMNQTLINETDEEMDTIIAWDVETSRTLVSSTGILDNTKVNVSGILGRLVDNRLVVDVDETFVFWNNGQSRLCNLLRAMTLRSNLEEAFPDSLLLSPRPLLNVTMDCVNMQKDQGFGQGNWVTAVYMVHLAAARAQIDHQIQCSDGKLSQMRLLLPWFDGYHQVPTNSSNAWPHFGKLPPEDTVCTDRYPFIRVDKMANLIVDDIRKMAVTLVGTRDAIRRHPDVPEDQPPLIPDVELDDAVIHFRCGDVMGGAKRNDFGMIKFNEYKKWISTDTKRIGILTQPFLKELSRRKDAGKVDGCRKATYSLVEKLHSFFPSNNITISIHNGVNETLPLAYARLAMANQSFTSLSSFSIFPVIGTFGEGYFQRGNRGVNPFTSYLPKYLPNLHEMDAPKLSTGKMFNMQVDEIISWLTSAAGEEEERDGQNR